MWNPRLLRAIAATGALATSVVGASANAAEVSCTNSNQGYIQAFTWTADPISTAWKSSNRWTVTNNSGTGAIKEKIYSIASGCFANWQTVSTNTGTANYGTTQNYWRNFTGYNGMASAEIFTATRLGTDLTNLQDGAACTHTGPCG